jgi:energy-coupling factor transporter transmembrane protein EcfT
MKEWSYTATPPLYLRGLFLVELYLYLYSILHICDIASHCCIFFVKYFPEKWLKMPKLVEGCILGYLITLDFVGMCVVTRLTASNMDSRKITEHLQRNLSPKMEENLC